ncbi:MAG: T9SS type A sorting domain-containing protein [Paludibacteraceae bacterium]|nr:T9SS type A sorting domain-containing protein [Paludibacteraceae bacterium]
MLCWTTLFSSQCFAEKVLYEAELATLGGNAVKADDQEANNLAYVKMNEGSITFKANAKSNGIYTLTIHYKNGYGGSKTNDINVNGEKVASLTFEISSSYKDIETTISLNAGDNTIALTKSWGWIDVDYFALSEYQTTPFNLSESPVTADATEASKEVYNFLLNNFEKKTISGIMTGNITASADLFSQADLVAFKDAGGKYPALVGFDLLFATGKDSKESWNQEYTNATLKLAEELWKKGGIPAFTWHWKDPSDAVEAFYVESAAGDKAYTTFDFTTGFISGSTEWNTNSETYKQLIEDIDHISSLFLQLQEAGVAAIFRPLHESGGNWFWWSSHSGEEFAALYRLIHDRMVKFNGVKNLIWVFNPQDASFTSWNPGADYYDVLSVDIYNDANNHVSNFSAFSDLKSNFGATKILALSENGPIPDVNNMYNDGATWSWWMPWYESWDGFFISKTSKNVWTSNLNDERIITLEEMPGWGKESDIIEAQAQTADINVYPSQFSEQLTIICPACSFINITDASGRSILSSLTKSGKTNVSCSNWNKGIYFVQVTNKENVICFKTIK